jgi:hypothetical protein
MRFMSFVSVFGFARYTPPHGRRSQAPGLLDLPAEALDELGAGVEAELCDRSG